MEQYLELDIRELRRLLPDQPVNENLADDLFLAEAEYASATEIVPYPCRFDGFLVFLCHEGRFDVDINIQTYPVPAGSLLVYIPGNILRLSQLYPGEGGVVRFSVAAISRELISSTQTDFKKIFEDSLLAMENPAIPLNEDEMALCRKYFDLITDISARPLPNIREAVVTLISSTFYWAGSLWMDRVKEAQHLSGGKSARARTVMADFFKLVQEYHMQERGLSFYAGKLFLTPKYLSKLIKNVSGRSAHEWIDSFVILEAKNRLKYSDRPIKQIVSELNFPNQTTFYRFFKIQTGMTPTEYRKS